MQKMGVDEESFVVDLKNLKCYKGEHFRVHCSLSFACFECLHIVVTVVD